MLETRSEKYKATETSYQICYDVMVTFHMLPHADSLDGNEREAFI